MYSLITMLISVLASASSLSDLPSISGEPMGEADIQLFLDTLNNMRSKVKDGSYLEIPDPLLFDEFEFNLDFLGLKDSHITLGGGRLVGLGSYKILSEEMTLMTLVPPRAMLQMDVVIPELYIEAKENDIKVWLDKFLVFGNGDFKLKITGPRIVSRCLLGFKGSTNGLYAQILDLSSIIYTQEEFHMVITGLFNNEPVSSSVSNILSFIVPELVEIYQYEISKQIAPIVKDKVNEFLEKLINAQ